MKGKMYLLSKILIVVTILSILFVNSVEAAESKKALKLSDANIQLIKISRYILANENQRVKSKYPNWASLTEEEKSNLDKNDDEKITSADLVIIKRHILATKNASIGKQYPQWILSEKEIEKEASNQKKEVSQKSEQQKEEINLKNEQQKEESNQKNEQQKEEINQENENKKEELNDKKETQKEEEKQGKAENKEDTKQEQAEIKKEEHKEDIKQEKVEIKKEEQVIQVSDIEISQREIVLEIGQETEVSTTIKPINATNKTIEYSSSNSNIATVDNNGKIVSRNAGIATITAKASNGKTATCKVTVKEPVIEVTDIKMSKESLTLYIGQTATLSTTIAPENATNKTVKWVSTNPNAVTVDDNGKITAVGEGGTNIIASISTKPGEINVKSATCVVRVLKEPEVEVTGVTLNTRTVTLDKGKTAKLTASISPENATNKTLTWGSINKEIATVDNNGVITAKNTGKAHIIVQSSNGKSAICEVTVKEPVIEVTVKDPIIEVTDIKMSKESLTLNIGQTANLSTTIAPENATNKTVKWVSTNPNAVTVDDNGKITAVGEGGTNIIASISTKPGEINVKSATCVVRVLKEQKVEVTVNKPETKVEVTNIKLNETKIQIDKGTESKLIATVEPSNATDKFVQFKSSDTNIVLVDGEGKIAAKNAGTATITAKTSNGKTATCNITVKEPTIAVTGIKLNKSSLEMNEGETSTLKATIDPTNATNKNVTWSSSNTKVAKVSNGKITAVSAGTVTITAKSNNGKKAKCKVVVNKKTLSILFVGNSKTYVADIPGKFKELAKSAGYTVDVTSATIGGKNLEYVASQKKSVITKKSYDYVIMQEQSDTYVNGYSTFLKGAKRVKELALSKNAKTKFIVRQLWLYKNSNESTRKKVYQNATKVAKEIGASLVYDGKAFDKSRATYSDINLFCDNVHQSTEGAYLSACCIYCTVYGKSPVGLSYTGGLSKTTAKKLQKVAANIYGYK